MDHAHRAGRSTATFTRLNEKYVRTCLVCLVVSAALHGLYLVTGRGPSSKPYVFHDSPIQVLEMPFEFEVPPAPPEVKRAEIARSLAPVEAEVVESTPEPAETAPFEPPPFTPKALDPGVTALPAAMDGGFVAFDTPPERLLEVKPEYPSLGVEAHSQGTVLVQVTIDETGRVVDAVVLQSDVIGVIEEACLKAARATPFRPAKQRDVPVMSRVVLPYRFALK
jgi:periplasmic protein TonB